MIHSEKRTILINNDFFGIITAYLVYLKNPYAINCDILKPKIDVVNYIL